MLMGMRIKDNDIDGFLLFRNL